jgi:nucleoside-diphosphate-sugar epimerase
MASNGKKRNSSQNRQGNRKPVVLISGAAGEIGSFLVSALSNKYQLAGLDQEGMTADCDLFALDLTSPDSVILALRNFREKYGGRIASVIHLAAYFDFTGEENPLYEKVNVEGTRNLLRALQDFEVEQFVYSGTMLVHRPGAPGEPIDEQAPIEPKWAYPKSKARAESVIKKEHGEIPYVLLHLAGLYSEAKAVPTLSAQIRRIYERNPKAHLYSGPVETGQSFIHRDDMIDAFIRTVDRRRELPENTTILVGEPETVSYDALQKKIAELIHGESEWKTYKVPKTLAEAGAWVEEKSEPVVPDDFDQGEKPFIRPFMVEMADDHYELDITRARELLGWKPKHRILDTLPKMIANLKADPLGWYETNGMVVPQWLKVADKSSDDPDALREQAETAYRDAHDRFRWAAFFNMALGAWLVSSPPTLGYRSDWMVWSDILSGVLVLLLAFISLSWRFGLIRWLLAAMGIWVMTAPLIFWAPTSSAYLNGTLVGALIFGLAVLARPAPGVSLLAATTGPTVPPGWDYSPSGWLQRAPIIALAFLGFYVSRYMAAYQLGHIDAVWDPFFAGMPEDGKNGTEAIITSSVSQAWPVPDAGLGALTYLLEILTGLIGSSRRWRTMPWLVMIFGIMIVPLGVISITFIVIQPIVLGTWCTLCLIAAAAMVIQIPYSVDELIATFQFLFRRHRAGQPILRVFLFGDTDISEGRQYEENFNQTPVKVIKEMLGGGVNVPWTLLVSVLIGIWLLFTRLTLGTTGIVADADHLIGSLVITTSVAAMAEVVRLLRFINIFFGLALIIVAFLAAGTMLQIAAAILAGLALIALSIPRGRIKNKYGSWSRVIV